jgi:nitrogenase subunit NifH
MFDTRLTLSSQVVEEIRKVFKEKVYNTVIPRNVRLAEAPSFGKPIILYDPESRGAKAYQSMAKEFLARNGVQLCESSDNNNNHPLIPPLIPQKADGAREVKQQ